MQVQSTLKNGIVLLPVLLCSLIATAQWNTSGNDINNTNSGNVGIGTSTPATKLHVDGKLKVTGANTGQVEFTGSNPYNPGFVFDGSLSKTSLYLVSSQNFSTSTSGATHFSGSYLQFYNNAEVRAYQQPFTIKKYYPGVGAASGLIIDNDQSGSVPSASAYNILSAKFSGTEVANIKGDGGAYFAGNVGIGTNPSTVRLSVAGSFKLVDGTEGAGKVLTSDANGLASWQTLSSSGGLWTDAGSGNIYKTATSGKVGIGTATPSAQLDITGFFRSTGLDGVPVTGTGIEIFYHNGGQDKSFVQSYSRSSSQFKGMDIEGSFVRINGLSGGNVGIGTGVPAYKLDIAGNQRILGTIGIGTAPATNGVTVDMASGYVTGYGMHVTGNYGGFSALRIDNSNTGPSSAAGLLMLNNANYVGFIRMDGTTASGTATYPGQLVVQSQQSGINYVALGATTGNPSHTFLTGYPSIVERLKVDNNGVTVANGSLVSPLYLGGTSDSSDLLLQATSGAGAAGSEIRMLVGNNGGTEAMRILHNGHVLIGTTTDVTDYHLAVKGRIIAEKVRVKLQSSGWPDYVFHRQYPLMSLKEVEDFIAANNHLPGVPAAREVEKEGLDLGDGQAVLLKKIEELTLYIIDINKRLEQVEAENKELKKAAVKD